MFITVHSSRVILASVCVLLLVSAFPNGVRSQGVSEPEADVSTTTEATLPVPYVSPYDITGIPGGDSVVGDFVVGPGKADVTISPGETKVVNMTVTNRTGERRQFNITVEDAQGTTDVRTPVRLLGTERGPYSIKDYLSFPATSFILDHNQRALVPVTVSIPVDAEPGGRYGSVLVDTIALESNVGETDATVPQSAIIARIGTLFFVTIPGAVEREAEMVEFATLQKQRFFQGGPIPFGILHKNTGSIHVAPYGEVRITNVLGEEVGFVELEPWFLLPGSERLREVSWNRELLFGRYTATAQINRSYDDIVDTASWTFWVLPWKILLGGFAVIFFVLFLIRAFFRTFEFKRKR